MVELVAFTNHFSNDQEVKGVKFIFQAANSPDLNPLDFHFWSRLKSFVNASNPTTVDEVMARIDLYFETKFDQEEMKNAILGRLTDDNQRCGGLPSRLNATFEHGGRLMGDITKSARLAAPPVPLVGPYNRPL